MLDSCVDWLSANILRAARHAPRPGRDGPAAGLGRRGGSPKPCGASPRVADRCRRWPDLLGDGRARDPPHRDGILVADQYWNGDPWEIDLARHRDALTNGAELVLELLPFDPKAKVYVPEDLRPTEPTPRVTSGRLVPVHRGAVTAAG
ncbi:hypothetical protein [Streptomyces hebeiensis]